MKILIGSLLIVAVTVLVTGCAPNEQAAQSQEMIVEAACGECQFGMPAPEGHDCDLAVRIDGKAYFVDGTTLDEHGDAHAADGFCNAIRKAKIKGEVKDGRFVVTFFELLPNDK